VFLHASEAGSLRTRRPEALRQAAGEVSADVSQRIGDYSGASYIPAKPKPEKGKPKTTAKPKAKAEPKAKGKGCSKC